MSVLGTFKACWSKLMIFYRFSMSNTISMCIFSLWQTLEEGSELHRESGHGFLVLLLDPQEQAAFCLPEGGK